jgi:hypothetical protein
VPKCTVDGYIIVINCHILHNRSCIDHWHVAITSSKPDGQCVHLVYICGSVTAPQLIVRSANCIADNKPHNAQPTMMLVQLLTDQTQLPTHVVHPIALSEATGTLHARQPSCYMLPSPDCMHVMPTCSNTLATVQATCYWLLALQSNCVMLPAIEGCDET